MQQWREPRSHLIHPKLVFTTGSKPQYGLKAFVFHDEWYVKIHGGTSQQYHYTGLENPLMSDRTDGQPNNLTDDGLKLLDALNSCELPPESVLFYVAGVYNSELANEFLEEAGSGLPLGILVPETKSQISLVESIARAGRAIRDALWLQVVVEQQTVMSKKKLEANFHEALLRRLGLVKETKSATRFKSKDVYNIPSDFNEHVEYFRLEAQDTIDKAVDNLYS